LASVYKVALSSSEILQNHNSVKNRYSNFVDTNLVLYFDPSKDLSYPNSINDLSGNSLNGALSNNTFTTPYLSFNGSSSEVSIPDNSLLEPGSGDWTVEAWINGSLFAGTSRVILGKFNNGGASQQASYGLRTLSTGAVRLEVGNGTSTVNSPSYILTPDTWYQVVGVWTNIASNSISLYINGVTQGSNSHSFSSVLNSTNPLYIGSYNGGEYSQYFDGQMGIVRIYNSALSASDVSKNFEANRSLYGI
jgi:hypothetical protein